MTRRANLASERGAVLIQTAIAATVLVGFGAFVADYGVLWIARHQAQNAADAGAMAGALARAYDDFDDPPAAGGVADLNASEVVGANVVWGAPPTPVTSFTCPADIVAADPNSRCVTVDAHRDGDNGSTALPTFFGPIFGIASQGVRATATARVLIPKATNCLRALAIPDKWTEAAGGPEFNMYGPGGVVLANHDTYTPPTPGGPGTGVTFRTSNTDPLKAGELGFLQTFTVDDILTNPIYRSSLVPLDTGLAGGYPANMALDSCNGQEIQIGAQISISTAPSQAAFADLARLYNLDPIATWEPLLNTIKHSCAPFGCAPPSALSPRLIAIAVFDVDQFQLRREKLPPDWSACPVPGTPCVTVVNVLGLFIADSAGTSGFLTSYPGSIPTDAPMLTAESSFLKAVTLVR